MAAYLKVRDPHKVNPVGGPNKVPGSVPVDELVVTIERIGLARLRPGDAERADVAGRRPAIGCDDRGRWG